MQCTESGPANRQFTVRRIFSFRRPEFRKLPGAFAPVHPTACASNMTDKPLYYFDNNATTRVAPEVVEAMLPFFESQWGNASSAYDFGHRVARHLDEARARLAA